MIPTWHLHMMSLHVSGGIPEQTVRDEAVGVHTINEWKCSLQGWRVGEAGSQPPAPHPPVTSGSEPHHASL